MAGSYQAVGSSTKVSGNRGYIMAKEKLSNRVTAPTKARSKMEKKKDMVNFSGKMAKVTKGTG